MRQSEIVSGFLHLQDVIGLPDFRALIPLRYAGESV
jgi:hypothetical protein